jgi:hypothetical protein
MAALSSEMLVVSYHITTWCHNAEDNYVKYFSPQNLPHAKITTTTTVSE